MADQFVQFFKNLRGRKVELFLSEALEARLRMYVDRTVAEGTFDKSEFEDETDALEFAITCCTEAGLIQDEKQHGLEATALGEVMTVEQLDEHRRRRKAVRDAQREGATMGVTPEVGQDIKTMHPRDVLRGLMRGNHAELKLGYSWDNAVLAVERLRDLDEDETARITAYAKGFRDGMADDDKYHDQPTHPGDYLEGYEHGQCEDKTRIHPAS